MQAIASCNIVPVMLGGDIVAASYQFVKELSIDHGYCANEHLEFRRGAFQVQTFIYHKSFHILPP